MNLLIILTFLLNNGSSTIELTNKKDALLGNWINEEKNVHIQIYKKNNSYHGKIIWLQQALNNDGKVIRDLNNPNPELRERSIIGIDIISDLKFKGDKWVDGKLYTPKKGKTVDCEVELVSNRVFQLNVSYGFFKTSKKWTRL